ncbi:MAG: cupin domain-containing protein [Syntrophobacteraceae bacterium]|jgi:quercetin dioxygenase-like cupin family protein|nr:cupin domain-containing protein [Syntrophobacteraceae bacterium]
MKIIRYSEAEKRVFDQPPARGVTGRVVIGRGDGATRFCMRVFELAPEGHTPRHRHAWEHEIFVHGGEGAVFQEGEWVPVQAGSVIFVPAEEEHQIRNTGKSVMVFVCVIPGDAPEL